MKPLIIEYQTLEDFVLNKPENTYTCVNIYHVKLSQYLCINVWGFDKSEAEFPQQKKRASLVWIDPYSKNLFSI